MKKLLSILTSGALALSLAACSSSSASTSSTKGSSSAASSTADAPSTADGASTTSSGKRVTLAKENDVISMDTSYATDGMSFEMIAATVEGYWHWPDIR